MLRVTLFTFCIISGTTQAQSSTTAAPSPCVDVVCTLTVCKPDEIEQKPFGKCCNVCVPNTCTNWFDGCNTCIVSDGKIKQCTEMGCQRDEAPYCAAYADGRICKGPCISATYCKCSGSTTPSTATSNTTIITTIDDATTTTDDATTTKCNVERGPQKGICPVAKCVAPPTGCKSVTKFEKTSTGNCCPKLCYFENAVGKQCDLGSSATTTAATTTTDEGCKDQVCPQIECGLNEWKLTQQSRCCPVCVPKGCTNWFDGCNDCDVDGYGTAHPGGLRYCSRKNCLVQKLWLCNCLVEKQPFCLFYANNTACTSRSDCKDACAGAACGDTCKPFKKHYYQSWACYSGSCERRPDSCVFLREMPPTPVFERCAQKRSGSCCNLFVISSDTLR